MDLAGQFFLKMILGEMSEWGTKKFQEGKSTMDDAMGKIMHAQLCTDFMMINSLHKICKREKEIRVEN